MTSTARQVVSIVLRALSYGVAARGDLQTGTEPGDYEPSDPWPEDATIEQMLAASTSLWATAAAAEGIGLVELVVRVAEARWPGVLSLFRAVRVVEYGVDGPTLHPERLGEWLTNTSSEFAHWQDLAENAYGARPPATALILPTIVPILRSITDATASHLDKEGVVLPAVSSSEWQVLWDDLGGPAPFTSPQWSHLVEVSGGTVTASLAALASVRPVVGAALTGFDVQVALGIKDVPNPLEVPIGPWTLKVQRDRPGNALVGLRRTSGAKDAKWTSPVAGEDPGAITVTCLAPDSLPTAGTGALQLSAGRAGILAVVATGARGTSSVGVGLAGASADLDLRQLGVGGVLGDLGSSALRVTADLLVRLSTDGFGLEVDVRAGADDIEKRLRGLSTKGRDDSSSIEPPRAQKAAETALKAAKPAKSWLSYSSRIDTGGQVLRLPRLELGCSVVWSPFSTQVDLYVDISVHIGPLTLSVTEVGAWMSWSPNSDQGPAVSAGAHPPNGLGAQFQTAALQGGGYLERQENDGYSGAFALRFSKFSLAGLAVFESADSAPSILVMAELSLPSAIPIGLGFELSRLGAVLGLNRTIDMEAMRSSVRTGAIGALLGDGMVEHANEVLPTLRAFFPARKGSHVLGPVARVSWLELGSGHLVNADLALAIEVPSFARVALLGSARVQIPDLPNLLKLRIDFAGGIDFSARQLWFDASLIDSEALELFQVTGDVALRLLWGDRPAFLLSVGGFHRDYKPEIPNMPAMRRLGLTLNRGMGGIELRAEAYLAITSNTFQAGGRLSARLSAGAFAIHGSLQIDTLVQFAPFRFDIAFDVEFGVEVFGFSLLSLRVHGRVAGPGPLEITAGIEIDLFFFSIEFEHTFVIGNSVPQDVEPALDIEEVKRELADALARHTAVRSAALADPAVVLNLRTVAADDPVIVVSPLAAAHAVQQKVPLDVPITHIGPPRFPAPVTLRVTSPMQSASGAPTEPFSPGAFIDVSGEAQRLALPSFEQHSAGLRFEFPLTFSSTMATASLEPRPTHIPEVQLIGALGDLMPMRVAALFGAGSGIAAVQTTAPRLSVTDERFGLDGSSALHAVGSNQLDRPLFRTAPVQLVSL